MSLDANRIADEAHVRWTLIAIAAIFAGAFALVAVITAPGPGGSSPRSTEPVVARVDSGSAPADSPATPAAAPPPPAVGTPSAVEAQGAPATLPLDPGARRTALEGLRREVYGGLNGFRWRVAECKIARAAVFVTVETMNGAFRIAEVRLEPHPSSEDPRGDIPAPDDHSLECVRAALAGSVGAAASATPGRRWEMPFDVAAGE